jgi:hydroxypyruvate isomerase
MPKFCANLSMLFGEHDFLGRFSAAAKAGFAGVEYIGPYAFPKEQVAETLQANNLKQVLFNLPAGNWDGGERGIGCLPDRVSEFQDGVGKAIEYAKALGCTMINCLSGILPSDVTRRTGYTTLVSNLSFAATALKKENILLIVEPINSYDIPGFFLNRSKEGIEVIDDVGSDNLKLQYDIYHMQRMEGELATTLTRLMPRIGHIQIADNPGRHEPGTGEINYPFILKLIDTLGYDGWVGCEYKPRGKTVDGLSWIKELSS